MNRIFIFSSGFGFTQKYWQFLAPRFQEDEIVYFEEHIPSSFGTDRNIEYIGIGHSLGFLKLVQSNINLKYLIGLNAFTHFLGKGHFLFKKRKREYDIFKANFQNNPRLTMQKFYKNCGSAEYEENFNDLNIENLVKDLNLLESYIDINRNCPIMIVNSTDDNIVPEEITRDNFAANNNLTRCLLAHGGHMLGYRNSEEIFKLIKGFIECNTR